MTSCGKREQVPRGHRGTRSLGERAVIALLVATASAGGADDNHATTLAAVFEGRHVDWR